MDSAELHEAAHRIHDGDALHAVAALLKFTAELAVEHAELQAWRERHVDCCHRSEPEHGVS